MLEGLSINSVDSTNRDIIITYTPSNSVSRYSYTLIKDSEIYESNIVNSNIATTIKLVKDGTYTLEVTTYDKNGESYLYKSGEYNIDKESPEINISQKTYKITTKDNFDVLKNVKAIDKQDGDITSDIKTNLESLNFNTPGIKKVEYEVNDKAGNRASEIVYVTVVKDNSNIVKFGQLSLVLIFILLIYMLYHYIRGIRLEKRFSKYTINSSKNKYISLFDRIYGMYSVVLSKISSIVSKSSFLTTRALRYDKYVCAFDLKSNIEIMSKKIFAGFIYLLFTITIALAHSKMIIIYEILVSFIIGFYTLDIFYIYKYSQYKKRLENDLLQAITVMNNAFKSGRSIIQAINLVSNELDGPISKEFKKIGMELSFGLDIELAFNRFADRIKLSEAVYLTSSLSVLNKTGGNIIKVFDSIEKTLYNRKKLQLELKSLTASSRFIMYVLMVVPIAFAIFMSIINKNYFSPMFNSPFGIVMIFIMIILYITYIIIVKRAMRVRM